MFFPPPIFVPPPNNEVIVELLKEEFGADLMPHFYQIAMCESSLRQSATHLNDNKTTDYGLLQINSTHFDKARTLGLDFVNSMKDNIEIARIIFDHQGYSAWLNCSTKVGLL